VAHVFRADGSETAVKNLGWLLRHRGEVTSIDVYGNGLNGNDASLVAYGVRDSQPWLYYSPFASAEVLRDWLGRHFGGFTADWQLAQLIALRELRASAWGAANA
jgi:hypothetical protein